MEFRKSISSEAQIFLELRYTTSKAHETRGWIICSLWDSIASKKLFSTMGGGYDMRGFVLGQWIASRFAKELRTLDPTKFHGLFITSKGVCLDGAYGWSSMVEILNAIGYDLRADKRDRNGNLVAFTVRNKNNKI